MSFVPLQSTNGVNWLDSTGWETVADVCEWSGVFCNSNKEVVGLALSNNNLDGTLPAELGLLMTLRSIDVSTNRRESRVELLLL